jgi:uncharacterized protein with PIN domain
LKRRKILKKINICLCGDTTENKNKICDTCELLNRLEKDKVHNKKVLNNKDIIYYCQVCKKKIWNRPIHIKDGLPCHVKCDNIIPIIKNTKK